MTDIVIERRAGDAQEERDEIGDRLAETGVRFDPVVVDLSHQPRVQILRASTSVIARHR